MRRCIVHVGMFKTGTTSIQRSLQHFSGERFVYANLGRHPNHAPPLFGMLEFQHTRAAAYDDAGRRQAIERFRKDMADAGDRTYLVSGEGIVLLPYDRIRRLRDWLREFFDDITVAAAVRPPASYVASTYQERLKRQRDDTRQPIRYRSYRRTFEKFDQLFGRERVSFWKFDPAAYPGGCAVRDFCRRFDIALPEERIVRLNESLSREAVGLLFTYREMGKELGSTSMRGPQNQQLATGLVKIGGTRFRFSPDVIAPLLERNRPDIEWMEARLGQSLHEELGEHRQGDVRELTDLLAPDPQAVRELLALLGGATPQGNTGGSPQDVARLVHALREQIEVLQEAARRRTFARRLLDRVKMAFG